MDKALVGNAASKKQVTKAGRKEELSRDGELNDIRAVLSTAEGQRFIWRLMEKCKTFNSIWVSNAAIHYNSGQQDIGHFIMSEIVEADEQLLFNLMKSNMKNKGDK